MKTFLIILVCVLATRLLAQQPAVEEPRVRFRAVDIYVTSTNALLAAYQVEFSVTNGVAKIVGIEGGEHPAFREPPFYDPKAIQHERVIIGAFNADQTVSLPEGTTRVATIHLELIGNTEPQYVLKLQTAANQKGEKIAVGTSLEEQRKPK